MAFTLRTPEENTTSPNTSGGSSRSPEEFTRTPGATGPQHQDPRGHGPSAPGPPGPRALSTRTPGPCCTHRPPRGGHTGSWLRSSQSQEGCADVSRMRSPDQVDQRAAHREEPQDRIQT
ncbi:hypothetical protein EYF80_065913 [Liparis tanakae]|uniref:Uncharacterized protein n=1 Tax=Liparis tanakae TaxID=230148 RepID=A0A4Z2E5S9_9TELE|nr:hypothetical protein EYF80_065913 [Liparis tanakae]